MDTSDVKYQKMKLGSKNNHRITKNVLVNFCESKYKKTLYEPYKIKALICLEEKFCRVQILILGFRGNLLPQNTPSYI